MIDSMAFEQYEGLRSQNQRKARHNLNYWEFGDYLALLAPTEKLQQHVGGYQNATDGDYPITLFRSDLHATEHRLSDNHLGAECLMNVFD